MLNNKIKKLAKAVADQKSISKEVGQSILNLKRSELKAFIKIYKAELAKRNVKVISSSNLSVEDQKELSKIYEGKNLMLENDNSLGAGLRIEDNDNIIDFTIKKYINDKIDLLK